MREFAHHSAAEIFNPYLALQTWTGTPGFSATWWKFDTPILPKSQFFKDIGRIRLCKSGPLEGGQVRCLAETQTDGRNYSAASINLQH